MHSAINLVDPEAPVQMQQVIAGYSNEQILTGVNFTLTPGSITGLLGRNGAGKTTLMRAMLGLLRLSSGEALVFGDTAFEASSQTRQRLGYVPQEMQSFGIRKVHEVIYAVSRFYPNWDHDATNRRIAQWALSGQPLNHLSKGEQQKVSILMALGHQPDLLVLDEPVASLDPAARREFMQQLVEMNIDQHQTILLSSHITSDIERIASHVAIMDKGKIVCHEPLDTLREEVKRLTFATQIPPGLSPLAMDGNYAWVKNPAQHYDGLVASDPLVLEDFFLAMTK